MSYKLLMWWVFIGKWKSDVNDKPKWEPIRINYIDGLKKYYKNSLWLTLS